MGGDDAVMTFRAVVGGHEHGGVGVELVAYGYQCCGASAEQHGGFNALACKHFGEVQERCYACSAAHEEGFFAGGVDGESVTQWVDDVQLVADLEGRELAGAVADDLDEEREGVGILVDVVYGDRSAEHDLAAAFDEHLDELSWGHRLHVTSVLQYQCEILCSMLAAFDDSEIMDLFHDKKSA